VNQSVRRAGVVMIKFWAAKGWLSLVVVAFVLSGCAETEFLIHSAKRVTGRDISDKPEYKIGKPYQIRGIWYYPKENYEYNETGIASWYGAKFHGRRTANGDTYDMNALTAAHRTLPMPSFVRVTNLENGRSLILKVTDRGPFARGRIIDISRRGSQLLGFQNSGTAQVRVQIMADKSRAVAARIRSGIQLAEAGSPITVDRLPKPDVSTEALAPPPGGAMRNNPPPIRTRVASRSPGETTRMTTGQTAAEEKVAIVTQSPVRGTNIFVQAGAFSRYDNANKVRARLVSLGSVKISAILIKGMDLFRVRLGPIGSVAEADKMLRVVAQAGYPSARIVVD